MYAPHSYYSDQLMCSVLQVGLGGTTQWKMCSVDCDTSLAVLFEITASAK